MGLILKDKIRQLVKGYPTVSDKYNVAGGILEGDTEVKFGDLVAYGATTGHYVKATTNANIAGIVLATNVKLFPKYPAGENSDTPVVVGEAFNLLLDGYVAVEVVAPTDGTEYDTKKSAQAAINQKKAALRATIKEGAPVKINSSALFATDGSTELNAHYTGIFELTSKIVYNTGSKKYNVVYEKLLAEIAYNSCK